MPGISHTHTHTHTHTLSLWIFNFSGLQIVLKNGRRGKHLPSTSLTNVADVTDIRAELHIPTELYYGHWLVDIADVGCPTLPMSAGQCW